MPCSDKKPCLSPLLRWVHSNNCQKLSNLNIGTKLTSKLNQKQEWSGEVISIDRINRKIQVRFTGPKWYYPQVSTYTDEELITRFEF